MTDRITPEYWTARAEGAEAKSVAAVLPMTQEGFAVLAQTYRRLAAAYAHAQAYGALAREPQLRTLEKFAGLDHPPFLAPPHHPLAWATPEYVEPDR